MDKAPGEPPSDILDKGDESGVIAGCAILDKSDDIAQSDDSGDSDTIPDPPRTPRA